MLSSSLHTAPLPHPYASLVSQMVTTCHVGDLGSISGLEDHQEEGTDIHSSILAWRIPPQRSLAGYSPWGHKESDTTERFSLSLSYHLLQYVFPKSFSLRVLFSSFILYFSSRALDSPWYLSTLYWEHLCLFPAFSREPCQNLGFNPNFSLLGTLLSS